MDDSDRWRENDKAEYHHHRNLRRKSEEAGDSVKNIIRATESRITIPPGASAGLGGVTPPVAKRLFAPGCKTPQVYPKAAGGQQDICTMLQHTPTYSSAEEADREAMEEDILQQEQEEVNKANRIQVLRERFEKESRLNASSINKMKGITWSAETGEGPTTTAPLDHLSTNWGSRFRKATKAARESEQAQAQEAKLKEEKNAAQAKQIQAQEESIAAASTGLAEATHAHNPNQATTVTGIVPATPGGSTKPHQGGSLTKDDFISDLSALKRDHQGRDITAPLSEVTPPPSATDSLLAISSISNSAQRRSVLSGSKYPSVPYGLLPDNCEEEDTNDKNGDMFLVHHRVAPGSAGHDWYLQLGIKYIEGHDSRTTLLMGLTAFMEIVPAFIDGFQLLPLSNPSTLPPLTSNSNIPKTAALAFKYFKVKNMSNMHGATTSLASAQISPARHNDDEEFKPPTMLW